MKILKLDENVLNLHCDNKTTDIRIIAGLYRLIQYIQSLRYDSFSFPPN